MKCAEKIRFETKHDAKLAAARFRHNGRKRNRPYRCTECGCWHLTKADAESRSFHRSRRAGGAQP